MPTKGKFVMEAESSSEIRVSTREETLAAVLTVERRPRPGSVYRYESEEAADHHLVDEAAILRAP
jgi:hypothetical protein